MASAVIAGVAAVGKELWGSVYPKIKNIIKFRSNLERLRKEMERLMTIVQSVKEQTEAAEKGGRALAPEVLKWLKCFEEIKGKVDLLEVKIEARDKKMMTFLSHRILGSKVAKYLVEVNRLIEGGIFPSGLVFENFKLAKIQHIPGPSIMDQVTALKNLMKVLDFLEDEDVNIIGVWGMGGVGKTTLVKNLNNALETCDSVVHFSLVMWATASKNADLRSLQSQLVDRLNLEKRNGESMESTASRLHQRLKQEKGFIFILDDVWEMIDLYYLGLSELGIGNKVVLTTRSMDVCRQMKTDVEFRLDVLNGEESWKLFIQNVGPVASLDHIEPIARKLNHECSGLPLAIIVVGASMRGKTDATRWNDALNAFQKSVPYIKGIEDKVYKPLMWSYDSLFFQGMDVKSCFLYCCLYPEDYSIEVDELVQCWIGEGLIEVSDNYVDSVNIGISMVEYLKDSCLIQEGIQNDIVIMHDVVRDVAIWISSSLKDGCKSLVRPGLGLRTVSEVVFQGNYKRISLIDNMIKSLPNFSKQYPEVSSLLLQGNDSPETPERFFQGLPGLRVLNINKTFIDSLPISLGQLSELRALLVKSCSCLPPLGGLLQLQVLDCAASTIKSLPEEIENLSNIRSLNLSHTCFIRHIRHGILSKLTQLEILDMTDSHCTWDVDGEGGNPFDELKLLEHLSFLSIRIEVQSSATVDFSWLERVRSFHLVVGRRRPRVEIVSQQKLDNKLVIFSDVCLSGKWVESLFQVANTVVLEGCHKLESMRTEFGNECCFSALKSLAILNSNCSFPPTGDGIFKFNLVPNLEKLVLKDVLSVNSISQLMHCLGLRFSKLRIIEVSGCFGLRYLFTSNGLPISSTHLFGQEEPWDQLEQIEVIDCFQLGKLPFTALNASSIKEIRGELGWWNSLKWDDIDTKLYLQSYFKPVYISATFNEGREFRPPAFVL